MEQNVERVLDTWWDSVHRMRRHIWLPITLLLGSYFDLGELGAVAIVAIWVYGLGFIWWLWPAFRLLLRRRKQKLAAILWIRRFHSGSQARQHLRFWEDAVSPWGQVITLCDESVRRPIGWVVLYVVGCAALIPDKYLSDVMPRHLSISENLADLSGIFFLVSLFCATRIWILLKRTVTTIRKLSQTGKALVQVRRVRRGNLTFTGTSRFVRCVGEDEIWHAVISTLAPEVDAIILDCGGDLTASIEWELRTLLSFCPQEKLIIARSEERATQDHGPTVQDFDSRLRDILGQSAQTIPTIVYPHRVPLIKIFPKWERTVRPAQRIIGAAAALRPAT